VVSWPDGVVTGRLWDRAVPLGQPADSASPAPASVSAPLHPNGARLSQTDSHSGVSQANAWLTGGGVCDCVGIASTYVVFAC